MLESFSQTWTHKMQKQKTICVGYFLTNFFVTIMKRNGFMVDVDCTINTITHKQFKQAKPTGKYNKSFHTSFSSNKMKKTQNVNTKMCRENNLNMWNLI